MTKDQEMTKLLATIVKDMKGKVEMQTLSQVVTAYHIRRPSGVIGLDIALDGGLPGGGIIQIHSRDGIGKNALANLFMAENQRIYGAESCMFMISFGYLPDLSHMRLGGMKLAYTDQELEEYGINPTTATTAERGVTIGKVVTFRLGDKKEAEEAPAEVIFETVVKLVESGLFQIGLVDEMGSGETKDNVEKGLEANVKVASWASLVTRFLQRMYTVLRKPLANREANATTLIVLNPARAGGVGGGGFKKPGYVPPDNQTSGHALKHAKAIDLHLRSAGLLRDKGVKVGKKIGWKIMKGKLGISEGAEGEYAWMFETGVDLVGDIARTAMAHDVIWRRGNKYYIMEGDHEGVTGGKDGVIEYLRARPALCQTVRLAAIDQATYGDDDTEYEEDGNV